MNGEKAKLQQENAELKRERDELVKEIRESERIEFLQIENQVPYVLLIFILL